MHNIVILFPSIFTTTSFEIYRIKNKREFIKNLKIYKHSTEELVLTKLDNFKEKWGSKYGIVIDS